MSDESFDPYRKWLGIRDAQNSLNHYRLLGLELFEDDPEVIENAADQRMSHVRTFQTGKHSALSQQILNELSAAKVCLLNQKRKAEYDRELREQMNGASQPPPQAAGPPPPPTAAPVASPAQVPVAEAVPAPPVTATPVAPNPVQPVAPPAEPAPPKPSSRGSSVFSPSQTSAASRYRRQKIGWQVPAAIGITLLLGLGLVVWAAANMGGTNDPQGTNNVVTVEDDPGGNELPPLPPPTPQLPKVKNNREEPEPRREPKRPPKREPRPEYPRMNLPRVAVSHHQQRVFEGPAPVLAVSFVEDGRAASVHLNGDVIVWNLAENREDARFRFPTERVTAATFSADGRLLLVARKDGDIRLFDVVRGRVLHDLKPNQETVTAMVISHKGNGALSVATGGSMTLWDLRTGKPERQIDLKSQLIFDLAASPNDQYLAAAGSDWKVRHINLKAREIQHEFEGFNGFVISLAYAPDNSYLLTGGAGKQYRSAVLWDLATGAKVQEFSGHEEGILSVAFLPGGNRIVTACGPYGWRMNPSKLFSEQELADTSIRVWDVSSGKTLDRLTGHRHAVTSVKVSPDGRQLLSGSLDRTVRLWSLADLATEPAPPITQNPTPEPPDSSVPGETDPDLEMDPKFAITPLSPADLFPTFSFQPHRLRASAAVVPREGSLVRHAAPEPPKLIKRLMLGRTRRPPLPLIDDEALDEYYAQFGDRVADANGNAALELAKDLRLEATRLADEQPGLSRYLLLRAFGLSMAAGDRENAENTLALFEPATENIDAARQLAREWARLEMVKSLQRAYRKDAAKRQETASRVIAATFQVARQLMAYALNEDALELLDSLKDELRVSSEELAKQHEQLRAEVVRRINHRIKCKRLAGQVDRSPKSVAANMDLGHFYLGELENLKLAVSHFNQTGVDRLVRISQAYEEAQKQPEKRLALAQALREAAAAISYRTQQTGFLKVALNEVQKYLSQESPQQEDAAISLMEEVLAQLQGSNT